MEIVGAPLAAQDSSSLLPACSRRFVLASNGLFLAASSRAIEVQVLAREFAPGTDAPVPFGPEQPKLNLPAPLPTELFDDIRQHAVKHAPSEIAALVFWSQSKGWWLVYPRIEGQSPGHVTYAQPSLDDESHLVFDIHSHGYGDAYFSCTDDASDNTRVGPHVSVVLGRCRSLETMTEVSRICVPPFLCLTENWRPLGGKLQTTRRT